MGGRRVGARVGDGRGCGGNGSRGGFQGAEVLIEPDAVLAALLLFLAPAIFFEPAAEERVVVPSLAVAAIFLGKAALELPGGGAPIGAAIVHFGATDDGELGGAVFLEGAGEVIDELGVLLFPAGDGGGADTGAGGGGADGEALLADEVADEVDGFVGEGSGAAAAAGDVAHFEFRASSLGWGSFAWHDG